MANYRAYLRRSRRRRRRRRILMVAMWLLLNQKPQSYYYRRLLNEEGRQRRDRNLIRAALHHPQHSTWEKCFGSGDDGVLITVTGFDHATFEFMLSHFDPLFSSYTPWCSKFGGVDGLNYRKLTKEEKRGTTTSKDLMIKAQMPSSCFVSLAASFWLPCMVYCHRNG